MENNLVPFAKTFTKTTSYNVAKINIRVGMVELFKSCSVFVSLFDINNNLLDVKNIIIDGADYTSWTNDDQTLIDLVINKINVLLITTTNPTTTDPTTTNPTTTDPTTTDPTP